MDIFAIAGDFFYIAMVLLWLAALAVSMRHVGLCLASCAMLAAICYEWPFGHDPRGSRYSSSDDAILVLFFALMAATVLFKLFVIGLARGVRWLLPDQKGGVTATLAAAPRRAIGSDIAITGAGAIAGLCLVSTAAATAVHWPSSLVAHAVALTPAVLGSLTPWAVRALRLGFGAGGLANGLRWSVLGTSLIAGLFIAWSIRQVVDRAESVAQDAPYCILVASHGPATTLLDLSPLTMRAHCSNDACSDNHAVLSIAHGDTVPMSLFLWSHRRQDFFVDEHNGSAFGRSCARSSFARELPLF